VVLRGVGNNPKAIVSAGWSYFKAHISFYALAAVFIVLSGLATTAVSYGSDANASSALTLSAVATVIIGGCEFSGGIGEPIGVVSGALSLSLVSSLLTFMSVDSNYQTAVIGCILILALAVKLFTRKKVR
jgi:ribose/xylose/arabinose/galactoside ABC-type transport system permease subunit